MITPASFHDLVRPELPGIGAAMLDQYIVQAARSFCERTRAWRGWVIPRDTAAGESRYPLASHFGQAFAVLELWVNGELLWTRDGDEEAQFSVRDAPFRLSPDLDTLILDERATPAASQTAGLQVYAALAPEPNSVVLPDLLYSRHSEAMRHLILGTLMVMGNKPWSDASLARGYLAVASARIHLAANRAAEGDTNAPRRTRRWDEVPALPARYLEEFMGSQSIKMISAIAPATSAALARSNGAWNYGMTLVGSVGQAVTATVRIEVSFEEAGPWLTWGTMSVSGTIAADGEGLPVRLADTLPSGQGVYTYHRAVVVSVTGTVDVFGGED